MVTRTLVALGSLLLAAPVFAQSADPVFLNGWTWSPETMASEATGLGDAIAASVRGSEALYWSPAALTFDSGLDIRAHVGERTGFGVVRHGDRLHIGFGLRRTFSRTRRGAGFDAENDRFEAGQLVVRIDEAALGAATRAGRLRIGVTLLAGPMKAEGAWSRVSSSLESPGEVREVRYDYAGLSEWQVGAASSAILDLLGTHPMARDQARIGVAMRWPTLARTAHYRRSRLTLRNADLLAPSAATTLDGAGPERQSFRLPATVSLGAEARVSVFSRMVRSVRVALGADWTHYDGVLEDARANAIEGPVATSFDDTRDWTFGGGIEGVLPLIRARVGLRERANHVLQTGPPTTRGRKPVLTFGISRDMVFAGKRVEFDFDSANSLDEVVLSVRLLL